MTPTVEIILSNKNKPRFSQHLRSASWISSVLHYLGAKLFIVLLFFMKNFIHFFFFLTMLSLKKYPMTLKT